MSSSLASNDRRPLDRPSAGGRLRADYTSPVYPVFGLNDEQAIIFFAYGLSGVTE
jgi:hypothetical protein